MRVSDRVDDLRLLDGGSPQDNPVHAPIQQRSCIGSRPDPSPELNGDIGLSLRHGRQHGIDRRRIDPLTFERSVEINDV